LEFALETFKIDVSGMVALDIGASTGGFSDCLLQHKAQSVLAVDVGTNQLHPKIRNDLRVINMEKTDFRSMKNIPVKVDIVVIDVSFISILLILSHLKSITSLNEKPVIALLKPQFEGQKNDLNKKGVVRDREKLVQLLTKTLSAIRGLGFWINRIAESPIRGGEGNREFLVLLSQPPNLGEMKNREEVELGRFLHNLTLHKNTLHLRDSESEKYQWTKRKYGSPKC
jgi:23S rRNA (cytidine1920-2'-O)/16S rRNA (cytidine1409-2'-O)-methyltransferase